MDHPEESSICVIYCTAPRDDSSRIARELVERRLIACVNITPVRSVYRWEGHICDESEDLLIIKTTRVQAEDLVSAIRGIHPYEVPEVIIIPVSGGYQGYLDWVAGEVFDP
ncbi:MAG TPA: divalent-cation tolerance protein CutA [Methanospirillum sp.]|nr:divalent-cation tolerance protein CutA [Methanospirillum sp.]